MAAAVRSRILSVEQSLTSPSEAERNRAKLIDGLSAELERRRQHDIDVADAVVSLADRLDALEPLASRVETENARKVEAFLQPAMRRLDETERLVRRQSIELIDQQSRLGFILEDVRKRLSLPFTPAESRTAAGGGRSLARWSVRGV